MSMFLYITDESEDKCVTEFRIIVIHKTIKTCYSRTCILKVSFDIKFKACFSKDFKEIKFVLLIRVKYDKFKNINYDI